MWRMLETPAIQRYLAAHEGDDVATLALGPFPFEPALRPLVIDQIKARQKARDKVPSWYRTPGIIFPPSSLVEQASSEATAAYKARIAGSGARFVDLTAGMGVDAAAFSANFASGICVEADQQAAELLHHNLPLIARTALETLQARAEDYAWQLSSADLVFLDPQRRIEKGRSGIYRLEDGQPDVTTLIPALAGKAVRIMLKTSPILDIAQAVVSLSGAYEIHVVEAQGQCREVLYLMAGTHGLPLADIPIRCVAIDKAGVPHASFTFTRGEEQAATAGLSAPRSYIFEPGPAVMKGGGFTAIAQRYGLAKLHPQTHLYTGDRWIDGFPGRVFSLVSVLDVDRKAVLNAVPTGKAHLKLRNFPGESSALQKRLGLAEGGEDQLFACTLHTGRRAILQTRRVIGPS